MLDLQWFCVGYVETGWVVRHGLAKLITHDEFDAHNNSVGTRTSLLPISEDHEYVSRSFYTHLNGRGQEMTTGKKFLKLILVFAKMM
jgi:hypothetical protein